MHFSSQLDKRLSTKYMQFIALGNILVYTFTLHTSDNNKEEYSTKQFRRAHFDDICKERVEIGPAKYIICRNHILSYTETRQRYWLLWNILIQLELYQFLLRIKVWQNRWSFRRAHFGFLNRKLSKIPILYYFHSNYIRRRHFEFLFWVKMRMLGSHVGLHFWPCETFYNGYD
jgi:hypothetical protein